MNKSRLDELKKLCEGATPGPWWDDSEESLYVCAWEDRENHKKQIVAWLDFKTNRYSDQKFICAARQALPELIEYCERLQQALEVALDPYKNAVATLKQSPPNYRQYFTQEYMEKIVDWCEKKIAWM